ncbi:MAG: hypothetical protein QN720_01820 [Nitrososphaeraceae archaeon]|nr:hypothetical protein [Nitrososphaeraceae archaeon]MDW0331656.1 hypothetical protein [Nitrososphaeraceae archaeon]
MPLFVLQRFLIEQLEKQVDTQISGMEEVLVTVIMIIFTGLAI